MEVQLVLLMHNLVSFPDVLVLIFLLFIFGSFKKTHIHSYFISIVLQLLGQGNCVTIYLKIQYDNIPESAAIKLETNPSSSMTSEFNHVSNTVKMYCIPCGQYENIKITPTLPSSGSWNAILSLGLDGTKDFAFAGSSWYDFFFHNIEVNSVVGAINPDPYYKKINLDCFDKLPLILLNLPSISEYYRSLFDAHNINPKIVATAKTNEMVRSLVGAGIGCSILNIKAATNTTTNMRYFSNELVYEYNDDGTPVIDAVFTYVNGR